MSRGSKPNFAPFGVNIVQATELQDPLQLVNFDSTFLLVSCVKICVCKNTAVNNDIIHTDNLVKGDEILWNCI